MLAADQIGFHTVGYLRHFQSLRPTAVEPGTGVTSSGRSILQKT